MLNYGKPVMGFPLCQTELDEGLGHLDTLDHAQKICNLLIESSRKDGRV